MRFIESNEDERSAFITDADDAEVIRAAYAYKQAVQAQSGAETSEEDKKDFANFSLVECDTALVWDKEGPYEGPMGVLETVRTYHQALKAAGMVIAAAQIATDETTEHLSRHTIVAHEMVGLIHTEVEVARFTQGIDEL